MTRKSKRPTPAELEAQGDALLRRQNEAIIGELAQHTMMLERIQNELIQPRNDADYVKGLEESDHRRALIANAVEMVHIVPEGGKTWIGVSIVNMRDRPLAIETARRMAEHFEAKLHSHPDPSDHTVAADYEQNKTPNHEFGREKRSLPR